MEKINYKTKDGVIRPTSLANWNRVFKFINGNVRLNADGSDYKEGDNSEEKKSVKPAVEEKKSVKPVSKKA